MCIGHTVEFRRHDYFALCREKCSQMLLDLVFSADMEKSSNSELGISTTGSVESYR